MKAKGKYLMPFYYAVRSGRKPGIYRSWDDCKAQVMGYPAAVYKKFKTEDEALAFLSPAAVPLENVVGTKAETTRTENTRTNQAGLTPSRTDIHEISTACIAYVDGSYEKNSKTFGYGVVLIEESGEYTTYQGSGRDPELASMRNVAGEIHGAMRAVEEAVRRHFPSITIFYDYMGIQCWAEGSWKCNKEGTKAYRDFITKQRQAIEIRFQKVKAHSGVRFNEMADQLAKQAAGVTAE